MQLDPLRSVSRILVTGANGFVGSEFLRACFEQGIAGGRLVAVVRPRHGQSSRQRLEHVLRRWVDAGACAGRQSVQEFGEAIQCIDWAGIPHVLASGHRYTIIHAAADTAFDLPLQESRRVNVGLTRDLLQFSSANFAFIDRFILVSTAFVAGRRRGLIREDGVWPRAGFNNAYEQSKWEAEDIVRQSGLPWCVVRPSIIVGDSRNGFTLHFRVVYSVVRLWLRDVVPRAPLSRRALVDLVPSNFVASALVRLCQVPVGDIVGKTLHLCAGSRSPGPVSVMAAAGRAFKRKPLPLSPPWILKLLLFKPVFRRCSHAMQEILSTVAWHIPYLGSRGRVFDTTVAQSVLGEQSGVAPDFEDYGERLFAWCADTSWGRKCLGSN